MTSSAVDQNASLSKKFLTAFWGARDSIGGTFGISRQDDDDWDF